jgi:glycosyltransferase involved in cell wall biosynthesis
VSDAPGADAPPPPPRTALVHDWLTGMRGGEKVLEAIAGLYPEAPVYTLVHLPGSVSPALEAHPIHTSFVQRLPGVRRHYRRYLPLFPAAIEDFDLTPYELVISTSHCVAKGVIPAPGAFHLCYCHTPMRYAWDQEHVYFPRRRGVAARLRNLALTALRAWDAASAPRVDLFAANSRFVAERIRRYYGRDAEVVPPPVDVDFFATPGDGTGDGADDDGYCLVVSALAPYKRVEVAIAACERLGLELRIVGTGPEAARLRRLAGPRTRLLGYLEGPELRRLYRRARLFLQPGIEDFGIAPVEALAAGTPVVAAGRGGVLDIVDDGVHGVLYPPTPGTGVAAASEALAAAIDKSLEIRFNKLELQRRARSFSPECFIDRLRACLDRRGEPERFG